jgi:phosphatidylserine/phosphatidylglycerophosphate/cardiolipin synthase-like enzyme
MVEVLDTTDISGKIIDIIQDAKSKLILIMPRLLLTDKLKELLEEKSENNVEIYVVFAEDDIPLNENNWFNSIETIRLFFCKNLHATFYLNEKELLTTSMNLIDFTKVDNIESGLLVKKDKDARLYNDYIDQIKYILEQSQELQILIEKIKDGKKKVTAKKPRKSQETSLVGDLNIKYTKEIKEISEQKTE